MRSAGLASCLRSYATLVVLTVLAMEAARADPVLLDTVDIAGDRWPIDALPPALSLDRQLGVVYPTNLPTLQAVTDYYDGSVLAPRAAKAPNGDYLVFGVIGGFYASGAPNQAWMWRSTDSGATWLAGVKPWLAPGTNEHEVVPFIDPAEPGRIYAMGNASTSAVFTAPMVFRYSDDNGTNWSSPQSIVPDNDPTFPGAPIHMRGTVMPDGTWLWGAYYRSGGLVGDEQFMLRSTNRGQNWAVLPGPHPDGWQHDVWEKFMEGIVVPTGGTNATFYLRAPGGHVYEMRSTDGGRSWSNYVETPDLVHPDAPPMVFPFSSGTRLIAFVHNQYTASEPHHYHLDRDSLWFATSDDAGASWSEPRLVIVQAKYSASGALSVDHDLSYVDLLVDGTDLHLFVGDGQQRALHLGFAEDDLPRFPTAGDLRGHSTTNTTIGHWRFESNPGYTNDSSGNALHLSCSGTPVPQLALPRSGPGAAFDDPVPQTDALNRSAANCGSTQSGNFFVADSPILTVTDFTIEAYIHRDWALVDSGGSQTRYIACHDDGRSRSWAFGVWGGDGASDPANYNALFLNAVDAAAESRASCPTCVIENHQDWYVAAAFDLDSNVVFYAKNLTDGGGLLTNVKIHAIGTLAQSTGAFEIARNSLVNTRRWQGIVDEVRFSSRVLAPDELLAVVRDRDRDGIADAWEERYGGTNLFHRGGDHDVDGLGDAAERVAGTVPTNPASLLAFTSVRRSGDDVVMRWQSVSNRFYAIRQGTNLLEGLVHQLTNGLPATPHENVITVRADRASMFVLQIDAE